MSGTGIAGAVDYQPATERRGAHCYVCGVPIDNGGHAARAMPHSGTQEPGAAIVCSAACAADPAFASPFKEAPLPEPETPHVRFFVNRWKKTAKFTYTNWRGETEVRHVVPTEISHRSTEYYPVPQWIMAGWDKDRQAQREFAMNRMWGLRWMEKAQQAPTSELEQIFGTERWSEADVQKMTQQERPALTINSIPMQQTSQVAGADNAETRLVTEPAHDAAPPTEGAVSISDIAAGGLD